jgi:uncharacterized Zn finger protein
MDNSTKNIQYKCTSCGYEETKLYPKTSIPEITQKCPECRHLTLNQVKYDYFRDGPIAGDKK